MTVSSSAAAPPPNGAVPARRDVRRNRARLLSAARDVLAAHGPEAPLALIAAEAGVSRTTLHRHFAHRPALIAALLEQEVTRIERRATELSGEPRGLEVLLHEMFDELAPAAWLRAVAGTVPEADGDLASAELGRRVRAAVDPLVEQARSAGAIPADVGVREVLLALPMAVAASTGRADGGTDPAARRMLHRSLFTTAAPGAPTPR